MRRRHDKPHTDDLYGPRELRKVRKDWTMETTLIVCVVVIVALVVMVMRF